MGMKKKEALPGIPAIPEVPAIPVLPKTSVNPQPRNEASPVAPAKAVKAVERAGDEKILAKPYDRNRSIEIQALIKSTLESPAVAQLIVGKNDGEALATITKVFEHALGLFEKNK